MTLKKTQQRLKCLYDLAQSELYVALASEIISNPIYLHTAHVLESLLYISIKFFKVETKKEKSNSMNKKVKTMMAYLRQIFLNPDIYYLE